jgi:hypothetical protein
MAWSSPTSWWWPARAVADFYRDVLGAELYREYGGTSVVLRAFGTWLLLVTGGGPTPDKPDVPSRRRPTRGRSPTR